MDSYDQHQGVRNLLAFMQENGAQKDETVGDFLRRRVATGCSIARGYLRMLDSPKARLYNALWQAAAEKLPNFWAAAPGGGFYRVDGGHENDDLDRLVDWFQLTYPREAARIEREIMGAEKAKAEAGSH